MNNTFFGAKPFKQLTNKVSLCMTLLIAYFAIITPAQALILITNPAYMMHCAPNPLITVEYGSTATIKFLDTDYTGLGTDPSTTITLGETKLYGYATHLHTYNYQTRKEDIGKTLTFKGRFIYIFDGPGETGRTETNCQRTLHVRAKTLPKVKSFTSSSNSVDENVKFTLTANVTDAGNDVQSITLYKQQWKLKAISKGQVRMFPYWSAFHTCSKTKTCSKELTIASYSLAKFMAKATDSFNNISPNSSTVEVTIKEKNTPPTLTIKVSNENESRTVNQDSKSNVFLQKEGKKTLITVTATDDDRQTSNQLTQLKICSGTSTAACTPLNTCTAFGTGDKSNTITCGLDSKTAISFTKNTLIWAQAADGSTTLSPTIALSVDTIPKVTIAVSHVGTNTAKSFALTPGSDGKDQIKITASFTDNDSSLRDFYVCAGTAITEECTANTRIAHCQIASGGSCNDSSWNVDLPAGNWKIYAIVQDGSLQLGRNSTQLKVHSGTGVRISAISSAKRTFNFPLADSGTAEFDHGSEVEITIDSLDFFPYSSDKLRKIEIYNGGITPITSQLPAIDCEGNAATSITPKITIQKHTTYTLTAKATSCKGRVSRPSAAATISAIATKPTAIPQIYGFSESSPSLDGEYKVEGYTVAGATEYMIYERSLAAGPSSELKAIGTVISSSDRFSSSVIRKSFKNNGEYEYCAQAINTKVTQGDNFSAIGSGTKCKTMHSTKVDGLPESPAFDALPLQQTGQYTLSWSTASANDEFANHFQLFGAKGGLNTGATWRELDLVVGNSATSFTQEKPELGTYSYMIKACNLQGICINGQQLTINHLAPYIQSASFDASCGTSCLAIKGIALTLDSEVHIQLRNSTETYIYSNTGIIDNLTLADENTLRLYASARIKEGWQNGGLIIQVLNPQILHAAPATIVIVEGGTNNRIDLIKRAPSISDKGNIYVGVDEKIYSLKATDGSTNLGWPVITGADVIARPTLAKYGDLFPKQNLTPESQASDVVFVGSKDHSVYAIEEDGSLLWQTKTSGEVIAQAELDRDNQLYVGSMDKALYAINAATGAINWQYPLPRGISQKPIVYYTDANSDAGLIYVTTDDQQIHIIDRKNLGLGALQWQDVNDSESLIGKHLVLSGWQPEQELVPERFTIVRLFYAVMQRAPSKEELTYFLYWAHMNPTQVNGVFITAPLIEIANAFLLSNEGILNFPPADSNSVFLDKLYAILFPNPDGEPFAGVVADKTKAQWLTMLDSGSSRALVLLELISSNEYSVRTNESILSILFYFYKECHGERDASGQCISFKGDSDGDGKTDKWEIENGFNPLDPFDTHVDIPRLSNDGENLGEFTLNISSTEATTHFQIYQKIGTGAFTLLADKLLTPSLTLTRATGSYSYHATACIRAICSLPSPAIDITITESVVEAGISPSFASGNVAPKNAPSAAEMRTSASFMMTSGNFRVTEMGSASFDLPLALPAGIAGVTPSLSLSYDSQRGESSAGVGWAVAGGSAISRCRQTPVIDGQFSELTFDGDSSTPDGIDRYCLDGQRLILIAHNSGPDGLEGEIGAVYRTEVDQGLKISIEAAASSDHKIFKVKGKDGSTKIYGGTPNSELKLAGDTMTWFIRSASDKLNKVENTINYSYLQNGIGENEVVLKEINYSGNKVVLNYITFDSTNPEVIRSSAYINNTKITAVSKLADITVNNHLTERTRYYSLDYQSNNIGKRELRSITECGTSGICKKPIEFDYNLTLNSAKEILEQETIAYSTASTLVNSMVVDANGDGKNDLVNLHHIGGLAYELCVQLHDGANQCNEFTRDTVDGDSVPIVLTDNNSDGYLEFLVNTDSRNNGGVTTNWYQFELSATELNGPNEIPRDIEPRHEVEMASGVKYWEDGDFHYADDFQSFDFNGDGFNDLIGKSIRVPTNSSSLEHFIFVHYWQPESQQYSAAHRITGFDQGKISSSFQFIDLFQGGWQLADFNADGRGDIVMSDGEQLQIYTSNNNSVTLRNSIDVTASNLLLADFNADGHSDIIVYNATSGSEGWQSYNNKGGTFGEPKAITLDSNIELSRDITPVVTDIDGDGFLDLFIMANRDWHRFEWQANSQSFVDTGEILVASSIIPNAANGDSAYFSDWDNDGRLDLLVKTQAGIKAYMNFYAPKHPGLMSSITQGNGLKKSITYGSMNDESLYQKNVLAPTQSLTTNKHARKLNISGASPLIKSIETSAPSSANSSDTIEVSYHYKGAQAQLGGRGWLGFAEITTSTDRDGQTFNNNTKFLQDFPLTGSPYHGVQTLGTALSSFTDIVSENETFYKTTAISAMNGLQYYQVSTRETRSCQGNVDLDAAQGVNVSGYQCSQVLLQHDQHDVSQNITSTYSKGLSHLFFSTELTHNHGINEPALSGWLTQVTTDNSYIRPSRVDNTVVTHSRQGQANISRESSFAYYPEDNALADMLKEEIREPLGSCTEYLKTIHGYDTWGNRTSSTSTNKTSSNIVGCETPIERISTTEYDAEGRYVLSTHNGVFTTKTVVNSDRNALGLPQKVTDANGVETDFVYDAFGTLVYTRHASGAQSTKLNKACGAGCYLQIESRKNGKLMKTDHVNNAGRVYKIRTIDVRGKPLNSYFTYDKYGNNLIATAPNSATVTTEYDILNRKASVTDSATGTYSSSTISDLSHTSTITGDISGGSQSQITLLNGMGENATVTDNLNNLLTYSYNSIGQLTRVYNDADSLTTVINSYDKLGRKIGMVDKDAGTWRYDYDALGQLVQQTDARGVITRFSYDNLGRKTAQHIENANTAEASSFWIYDNNAQKGVLISERSGSWQRHYYYDSLGRNIGSLTNLDNTVNCFNGVHHEGTSNDLRITDPALKDPVSSRCVIQQLSFDDYGRVLNKFDDYRRLSTGEFIEARGILFTYAHNQVIQQQEAREGERGRIYYAAISTNDLGAVDKYTKGSRTISLETDGAGRTNRIYSGEGNWIQDDNYSYDGLGNLKSRSQIALTLRDEQRFGYDSLNRITTVNNNQLYHYQDNGNFQSKDGWSHSYGELAASVVQPLHAVTSRIKNGVTESFFYDENGNQLSAEKNGVNWRTIEYNGRNKATYIKEDGEETRFAYDANNSRYKRTTAGQVIYYVGALELTIQSETESQPQENFIKRAIAGQALQTYYSSGNAQLKWLYKDILGSLVAITNEQGELLKRFSYDAFGMQQEVMPTDLDRHHYAVSMEHLTLAKVPINIRGYTGHEPVGTNGRIIHMNGRIYDAALGRVMQADPFIQAPDNSQNYNRFSYVLNNPLTFTDPSGYIIMGMPLASIDTASFALSTFEGCQICQLASNTMTASIGAGNLAAAFSSGTAGIEAAVPMSGGSQSSGEFSFTQPKSGNHIAQDGENISSSILDFLTGGKANDWFYQQDHEVSKRLLRHEALKAYIEAYESSESWSKNDNEEFLIQDFGRQHTTYSNDFVKDVTNILGAWGEGKPYHDYGTNALGSFSIRGRLTFDKDTNSKSLSIEVFNRWSMSSLTRNPLTRQPMFNGGLKNVNMYIQINLNGKLE